MIKTEKWKRDKERERERRIFTPTTIEGTKDLDSNLTTPLNDLVLTMDRTIAETITFKDMIPRVEVEIL